MDYTTTVCPGCYKKDSASCPEKICLREKGYRDCLQCNQYSRCKINSHIFDPANCNMGISADDVTKVVMPYYSNFWLDKQKQ